MKKEHEKTTFQVGDRVLVLLGGRKVRGEIVEDRGPLGVGGRRLFRIEVPQEPDDPATLVRPEEELEYGDEVDDRKALDREKIISYLKHGGMLLMLQLHGPGGKCQPRVWLCCDTLGNITHTFRSERGLIGGATVPAQTLFENRKVFLSRKEEVKAFLASFGLDTQEAEAVIKAVGTSPRLPATKPRI